MPTAFKYSGERKSHQSLNEVYFWTSVIKDWKHLLNRDARKMIIIQSFQWLVLHELVHIYGYVLMPNHIHVLWEQLKMNGKESPKESFEKYTGHMFLKQLRTDKENLDDYATEQKDRNYIFWQRDPLAILIRNRTMAGEKLDYMPARLGHSGGHYNPIQQHWNLCNDPVEYRFSSAGFLAPVGVPSPTRIIFPTRKPPSGHRPTGVSTHTNLNKKCVKAFSPAVSLLLAFVFSRTRLQ